MSEMYCLNLVNIRNSEYGATIRLLASDIIDKGYIHPGDFFKSLSDSELKMYSDMAEDVDNKKAIEELVLLSLMLSAGEGLELPNDKNADSVLRERCNMLHMMLILESLGRKKLIRVFHENFSFGEETKDRPLAEPIMDDPVQPE